MARSGPWMLFSGMVATTAGLAIVLGHNVWSGAPWRSSSRFSDGRRY
jgi:hypothetical protein